MPEPDSSVSEPQGSSDSSLPEPHVHSRRLALGFALLAAATYGLIVLGALVRAHGAGLACPDWPLCFGNFVPDFDLRVAFEWSHRVVAGGVGLVFLALWISVLRHAPASRAAGRLLGVAAVLLATQILLGALTVWQLLASWTVTSHLLTGNAFAVALALTSRALFESTSPVARAQVPADLRRLLAATLALLVIQMTLGGLVSSQYAGLACPEWPACMGGVWFPTFSGVQGIHVLHRLVAYALVVLLALCAWRGRGVPGLSHLLLTAVVLVIAQVGVGIANVLLRLPVEVTGLHSGLAALLLLCLCLGAREAWLRRGVPA